jgi:hypothetical protein
MRPFAELQTESASYQYSFDGFSQGLAKMELARPLQEERLMQRLNASTEASLPACMDVSQGTPQGGYSACPTQDGRECRKQAR